MELHIFVNWGKGKFISGTANFGAAAQCGAVMLRS